MSNPKLYYFAGKRGDAEAIRIMFSEAGMPYDEVPVSDSQVSDLIARGDLLFNRLPMVEFPGLKLVESAAILEHIALLADKASGSSANKYCGRSEEERTEARSLCALASDLRRQTLVMAKDKSNRAAVETFQKEILPSFFKSFDRLAVASGADDKGLGKSKDFTFGDVAVLEAVNAITVQLKVGIIRPYANLKDWHDKAIRRANIEKYLGSRADAEW